MFGSRIHFLGPALDLTLIQRAEEIYRIQYAVSRFLTKKEWIISGKIAIAIENKEDTISKIIKDLKNGIRRNTLLKDIPNDLLDNVSSTLIVYFLKYSDDSLFFRYILGRKNELSQYSETLIYNYKILIDLLGFVGFKTFLKNMIELLNAQTIEVTDDELGVELQAMFGSYIDIQIIKNNP